MAAQSKRFNVLFLVFCCVVILMSFLAVRACAISEASFVSHHAHTATVTPSFSHSTLSVGTTLLTYNEHLNAVSSLAWSPDGKYIASASYDKTIQVWDSVTGHRISVYRGHTNWVSALAWSPAGQYLASASYDKTVQVWDAATGKRLLTYRGHSDTVTAVAWSPDGTYLASAG